MTLPEAIRGGSAWVADAAREIAGRVFSAMLWFLLLAIVGAAFLVAGVFVLAGLGSALITAGVILFVAATLIFKGMTRG